MNYVASGMAQELHCSVCRVCQLLAIIVIIIIILIILIIIIITFVSVVNQWYKQMRQTALLRQAGWRTGQCR